MVFASTARTDMAGIQQAFRSGHGVKLFRHSAGWSVQCPAGLLNDSGTEVFVELMPLLDSLKAQGVDRMVIEP